MADLNLTLNEPYIGSAVSPDVETTSITGGTRVTITDKDGAHVFDVMDGEQGPQGDPSAAGAIGTTQLADVVRKGYVRAFATVSDMQAATDLLAGMICHTSGYHSSEDGGAAYYTVLSSGTANGYDVLALQNDLYATLVITEPYVTPEQYGAYGNGTTDDTAAFVRMFARAKSIKFKRAAIYLLNSNSQNQIFVLTDGMHLDFNGATIESNYIHTFRNYDVSTDASVLGYSGNGNIEICGGTLKYGCLAFAHANGITVRDMQFVDAAGIHVFQLGGCKNVLIEHCLFKGLATGLSGTYEAINIECMDYTGQPYYPSSSADTYDLTPTTDVTVCNCTFMPDVDNAAYNYMGNAVGTHYVPKTTVDGVTTVDCDPFSRINILDCNIEAADYSIRCNNWYDSVIDGCTFKSRTGVQCGLSYMSNDSVRISNNRHVTTSTELTSRMLELLSGDNTRFAYYGNTARDVTVAINARYNARAGAVQGAITFSRCDGLLLPDENGYDSVNKKPFVLHDSLSFADFNRLVVLCGAVGAGTWCEVPIHAFTGQGINVTGEMKGCATNPEGTLITITVVDANTLASDSLNIRGVIGYV